MTLIQVPATLNILLAEILSAFSLPPNTPVTTELKDLESDTFDILSLRTQLQKYQQWIS